MTTRGTQLSRDHSSLIVDLESSPLLHDLTLEQLNALARHCRQRHITTQESRKPLGNELQDQIVFIAEGLFENAYYSDPQTVSNPTGGTIIHELRVGDIWGTHFLGGQDALGQAQIHLRAVDVGRLIYLPAAYFKRYLREWVELQRRLTDIVLRQNLRYTAELGDSLAKLNQSDTVLKRIESVADLLIESFSGQAAQEEVVQKKYLLTAVPKVRVAKSVEIEQAYLSATVEREDRIRRQGTKGRYQYTRTTKVGTGLQRKTFDREITAQEYSRLLEERQGNVILKERDTMLYDGDGKIVIDRFMKPSSSLVIVEVDFESRESAERFVLPPQLQAAGAKDITENAAYLNQSIALNGVPYRDLSLETLERVQGNRI